MEDRIKIPSDVINDLKLCLKELDDGNNHQYISHLSGTDQDIQRHNYLREVYEQLLKYITEGTPLAIQHATIYLTALDNITRTKIPPSLWKYLSVDYHKGNSLKDNLALIKNTTKVQK